MTLPITKSLSEATRSAVGAALLDVHSAQPGRVKSYDKDTQTADVQPLLQRVLPARDDEDEDAVEDPPVLTSVPVLHPRVGNYYIHMPVEEGDLVLLVFSEGDTNGVRESGQLSRPSTVRRHGMSGAVALPGYFTRAGALSGLSATKLEIGRIGGPIIEIDGSTIDVGGTEPLVEEVNLQEHLDLIATALDAIAARINALDLSGVIVDASYGVVAKGLADALYPLPTTITRGT